jgi:peptide deformylase
MSTAVYEPHLLEVATDNDPCLKTRATEVASVSDPDVQQLIADMIETMYKAPGIGLAAPQVRQSLRIMVFHLPAARDDVHHVGVPLTVLVNPVIEPIGEEKVFDFEGCLSVPGMRGKVPRYRKIKYCGLTATGDRIEREAEGWHARLVQHEFDHLNGILYPELMEAEDKLITFGEWKTLTEAAS